MLLSSALNKIVVSILLCLSLSSDLRATFKFTPDAFPVHGYVHEFGLQWAPATPMDPRFGSKELEFITAVLRCVLIPTAHHLQHDESASAEIKKAGIALVNCSNEVLHILNSPHGDHTADTLWALTDAFQCIRYSVSAIKKYSTDDDLAREEALFLTDNTASQSKMGTRVLVLFAVVEYFCAIYSSNHSSRPDHTKEVFIARSTLSALRLMRNSIEAQTFNCEKNIYNGLLVSQILYAAFKIATQPFQPRPGGPGGAGPRVLVPVPAPAPVPAPPPAPVPPRVPARGPLFVPQIAFGAVPDDNGNFPLIVDVPARLWVPAQHRENNVCSCCLGGFTALTPAPDTVMPRIACMPCGHVFCAHEIRNFWNLSGRCICLLCNRWPVGIGSDNQMREYVQLFDLDLADPANRRIIPAGQGLGV